MDLLSAFEQLLRHRRLVEPGQKVLVAFSGGADSTALLHLFVRLRETWSIEVSAAHLNHLIRVPQSDNDEAHCRQVCARWRVPFFSRKVDVLSLSRQLRLSLEATARQERYRFLEEVADSIEAEVIATGHTLDDQAETVLLNLARGAGTAGLAGIPERRGKYIRPLLGFKRSQIADYCEQEGLAVVVDTSNTDLRFSRNRIRHRVVPELRALNPRFEEAVARLSIIAREEEEWWQQYLQSIEPEFTLSRGEHEWNLNAKWLMQQPKALQRRVLRYAVQRFATKGRELEFNQLERLLQAVAKGERLGYTLPGGETHITIEASKIRLWQKLDYLPVTYEITVQVPGVTVIPPAGLTLFAEYSTLPKPSQWRRDNWEVWLDAEQVGQRLQARNWRAGDRIQPLGLLGTRKISDILIDRKIPQRLRPWIPVVCDERGIIWVVGVCIAHRVRCNTQTVRALHMRAEPRREW